MDNLVYNPAIPVTSNRVNVSGELIDLTTEFRKSIDPKLSATNGGVKITDLYLPHFGLRQIEVHFTQDISIHNDLSTNPTPTPGFGMFYNGSFSQSRKGDKRSVITSKGEQNFLFDPNAEIVTEVKANTTMSAVLIAIDPSYFDNLLPDDEHWAEELRLKIQKNEAALSPNSVIASEQHHTLRQVLENPLTGKMRVQMQEAALCQLLLQNLHQSFCQHDKPVVRINPIDREIIRSLKDHLSKTFSEDHSLSELARQFGMNQNKLSTLFRQLYNMSIFDYLASLKMDHAKMLLERERMRVKDIAPLIGYKNPHHFTAAFRKKFGYTPSQVR